MNDLTYTLCQRNRDGSHATQADRLRTLTLVSRQLRELGFRQMRAGSLKDKHVDALLARWRSEGLSAGTLKNRVAHVRWWAEKIGKAGVIPADNAQLAIPERQFVTNENKARHLALLKLKERLDTPVSEQIRRAIDRYLKQMESRK